jgi:2-phospho-L-lactate/phosphoenolpyruvate guanylyltransferase
MLSESMLLDVVDAFQRAGMLAKCNVVTSDERAANLAERAGANVIAEPSDRGVNAAVAWGIKNIGMGVDVMVVPSDLPRLRPGEIRNATLLKSKRLDVVLSPSRAFDGTNLLLMSTPVPFELSYDKNSFWNHVARTAAHGLRLAVYTGIGFLFDVDSPDDLAEISRLRTNRKSIALARRLL